MKLAKRSFELSLFVVCLCLSTGVLAQSKIEPVPENIKTVEQPDSPVQVAITGIYGVGSFKMFGYSVRNIGTKEIRCIVMLNDRDGSISPSLLGLPGVMFDQLGFQGGLEGGAARSLSYPVISLDGKSRSSTLSVDWVLFKDGTFWGPDKEGQSEFLLGLFDGQRRFVADVKGLLASKDDGGLRALITRDGPPSEMAGIENSAKRQMGLNKGYFVAKFGTRADLLGRGDLTGVPARIRDIELDLGLVPPPDDKHKQVTMQWGFNAPIKFAGLSVGGRKLVFDDRFSANGDWLTGSRLKIRNDSGKTIKSVFLNIHFPETVRTGHMMTADVRYGPHPVTQVEKASQPRVAPGQSFEIVINEEYPGEIVRFVARQQDFNTISRAVIDISHIEFEDGTRWSGGVWTKRDPENPQRWITIKQ